MEKENRLIYVFDTHTQSDVFGDAHQVPMYQYEMLYNFVVKQKIPEDELILLGGDFNGNKYGPNPNNLEEPFHGEHYMEMLHEIDADVIPIQGSNIHMMNSEQNQL